MLTDNTKENSVDDNNRASTQYLDATFNTKWTDETSNLSNEWSQKNSHNLQQEIEKKFMLEDSRTIQDKDTLIRVDIRCDVSYFYYYNQLVGISNPIIFPLPLVPLQS